MKPFIMNEILEMENLYPFVMCSMMQTAFTTKRDYGAGDRQAQWATDQRTMHGLNPPETEQILNEKTNYKELSELAEQARKRAEVAR